jgi:AP-1 complex subunit beta-1
LTLLTDLLTDKNPMVISNAVAAISEIQNKYNKQIIDFDQKTTSTLLEALKGSTEWGQIFILDAFSNYEPKDEKDAIQKTERIIPHLSHANSAVVLSSCKVLLKLMKKITTQETLTSLNKKMGAPLVTLLNSKPEIQYVALRNISLIVQAKPEILQEDIKVFFCKYNDPIYVKLEKIDIMIKLSNENNIEVVLSEFKEYSSEVDVEFVRKSVRSIGRCAIKIENATQKCVDLLIELIQTKINYIVQEGIIVIKDIFRKYPGKYESVISTLCQNLEHIDEPNAKAAMIWILGEYADKIKNSHELIELFMDNFHDEDPKVQLQLLTSCVKLSIKKPKSGAKLIKQVLDKSTNETDNPGKKITKIRFKRQRIDILEITCTRRQRNPEKYRIGKETGDLRRLNKPIQKLIKPTFR